ncbi:RNA polymerase sigma factor [Sunxiuqinia sp. A32]|uniref:RNA polymerase sigma factor n=1 Tax=Sunxiuqinia sp. A32 TaxID=3461496 RepID=UPI00404528A2
MNLGVEDTDSSLVASLQKGNKRAFKILFDKYGQRLYQFSLKYLRDKEDAEDLLNEVFLKIWENRLSLKTNTSFQAYLFTIAYNNIRQRFLKKSREEKYIQIFATEYLFDSSKGEDQLDYQLFLKKLSSIVELLPSRRKEIFILSYKEELGNSEIAEKLDLSVQFVKNQLSIARKFVAAKVKEDSDLAGELLFYLFLRQSSL